MSGRHEEVDLPRRMGLRALARTTAALPVLVTVLAVAAAVGLAPGYISPAASVGSQTIQPAALARVRPDSPERDSDPASPPEAIAPDASTKAVASSGTEAAERSEISRPDSHDGATSRGGQRTVEAASPTPTPTPTPRREPITYHVVAGDTVSALAERFGISAQTIVKANDLADPEALALGQELVILPRSGVRHVVSEGETLLLLADRYSVIPEEIAAVNDLAEPYLLQIGQGLVIPEVTTDKVAAVVAPRAAGQVLKPSTYVVAASDTLSGIAARLGIRTETLRLANPALASGDALAVGEELTVPPVDGVLHRVGAGDTLSGVAARYGASAAEIASVNGIGEPYLLSVGLLLVVPGGMPPAPPATASAPLQSPSAPAAVPTATPRPNPTTTPATATPKPAPQPTAQPTSKPPAAPAPAASNAGARIVANALKYRGSRYTWGGTSPATGFDCSGFVWYAYTQAGVPLPRDLWGQYNSGRRVGRSELQPGDIVFFQNTYRPGLSHDGIYIGGGQFIQAASENTGVIVSSLSEPYWAARYLGATRP
jgi:peptidoglycan DL-endopeptidase LytE